MNKQKEILKKIDELYGATEKIKLPKETILELYFTKGERNFLNEPWTYYKNFEYTYLDRVDLTEFILGNGRLDEEAYKNESLKSNMMCPWNKSAFTDYKINILPGANCENSQIPPEILQKLFLNPDVYDEEALDMAKLNTIYTTVEDINLSNNNFSNIEWDIGEFLRKIYQHVFSHVESFFYMEIDEINSEYDELDWNLASNNPELTLYDNINKRVIEIVQKLIPNLANTGIRIISSKKIKDLNLKIILATAIESGKFDGCYISKTVLKSCDKDHTSKEEVFYYQKEKQKKK